MLVEAGSSGYKALKRRVSGAKRRVSGFNEPGALVAGFKFQV
jgi:hypothetical protein